MRKQIITRRKVLQFMGASAGFALVNKTEPIMARAKATGTPGFIYCLNMATIRGQKLGFIKELETASAAGFGSVEIWIDSLQEYLNNGGTVAEAKKHLDGFGLKVEDSISFNEWIVDNEAARKIGIENMKREMGVLAE